VPTAAWLPCVGDFECAELKVPLDYADPGSDQIGIELVRLPASDPAHRIGSLLVNPGGPGGSGVDFVREYADIFFSSEVRARFDIVGFDPRGVGTSSPIQCGGVLPRSGFETAQDQAELTGLVDSAEQLADACRVDLRMLAHMGTANVARDLDRIRIAVGERTLTYFGLSYGTLLGALYANMYPSRVRAMVLDGALDPSLDLAGLRAGQAAGFEHELTAFLDDCAAHESCDFHSGGKTREAFRQVMAANDSADDWAAVAMMLYLDRSDWQYLAEALQMAQEGDANALGDLLGVDPSRTFDARYINEAVSYRAVTCLDFAPPGTTDAYVRLSTRLAATAPDFGAMLGLSDLACAYWPAEPVREPAPVRAAGAPLIVVVGTTGDPATPYGWSVALARELTSGVLLTRDGDGHTGYMFSGCIRELVDPYLLDLDAPPAGMVCD
jgi:pimeloyl-ACP methyl ester carboxylesterase